MTVTMLYPSGTRIITKDPLIKYAIVVRALKDDDYTGLWGIRDSSTRRYRVLDAATGTHTADLLDAFFRMAEPHEPFPKPAYTKIIPPLYNHGITYHCDDTASV